MEYRKDVAGEKLYASRNFNHLQHSLAVPGANRPGLDWSLTLRQGRKSKPYSGTESAPVLHTAALAENRHREPLTSEHPDGPYQHDTATTGLMYNYAHTCHLLQGGGPRASGSGSHAGALDWHLDLRGGLHQEEIRENRWRRHHTRSQPSFDHIRENCNKDNLVYQKTHVTPEERRPDRKAGAIPCETIRDDPISFRRWPGCEGTQAGQWRHLIEDRSKGRKTRRAIQAETMMRSDVGKGPRNFHPITDNRSDACLVEMLGKKRWCGAVSRDPMHARPPEGDAKLHYLSQMHITSEDVPEVRDLRKSRHPRLDQDIPERHTGRMRGDRG